MYGCIFQKDKECPVRVEYKLEPESLVEYCKVCAKLRELTPTNIKLTLVNLQWYTWAKEQGYSGSLSDFVNESIDSYFHECHGRSLAVVIDAGKRGKETKKED